MRDLVDIGELVAAWARTGDSGAMIGETAAWDAPWWAAARLATEIHGIGPRLHCRLPEKDPATWPAGLTQFRDFVRSTYELNTQRAALWCDQLSAIAEAAARAGIPVVGIKGAALVPSMVVDPVMRPAADIDLLVPSGLDAAFDPSLRDLGYVYERSTGRHRVYYLASNGTRAVSGFGEDPRNPLRLELHEHAAQDAVGLRFDATRRLLDSAGREPREGRPSPLLPARHALLTHLMFHAAQDMVFGTCRLTELYDVAALAGSLDASDWRHVLDAAAVQHVEPYFLAALAYAGRYAQPCAPHHVTAALAAATPARTRALIDRTRFSELTFCAKGQSSVRRLRTMVRWGRSRREQLGMLRHLLVPTPAELSDVFGRDEPVSLAWYYRRQTRHLLRPSRTPMRDGGAR